MHLLQDLPEDEAMAWAAKFSDLARYNSEVRRGIMHTFKWRQRMEVVQAEFDRRTVGP
jgi:hypothetical protein